jgi:hypothetical protein
MSTAVNELLGTVPLSFENQNCCQHVTDVADWIANRGHILQRKCSLQRFVLLYMHHARSARTPLTAGTALEGQQPYPGLLYAGQQRLPIAIIPNGHYVPAVCSVQHRPGAER